MKLLKRRALFLLLWHNYKKASNRKWWSERRRQDHKLNLTTVIFNVNVLAVIVLSFRWSRRPLAAEICLLITSSSCSRRLIALQRWQKIAVWFAVIGSFLSACLFLTWYKHGTGRVLQTWNMSRRSEAVFNWFCLDGSSTRPPRCLTSHWFIHQHETIVPWGQLDGWRTSVQLQITVP